MHGRRGFTMSGCNRHEQEKQTEGGEVKAGWQLFGDRRCEEGCCGQGSSTLISVQWRRRACFLVLLFHVSFSSACPAELVQAGTPSVGMMRRGTDSVMLR